MPMFNLNTDAPETSYIKFTAGERGEVGIALRGQENPTVDVQKGETVTVWFHPDRAEDDDA